MSGESAARRRLAAVVEALLDERTSSFELARAASDLYDCLSEPVARQLSETAMPLPSGLALSPADAAACVKDSARTAKFLRAVHAAIGHALERFAGETIHVVYAGSGPLAPLVIPLMPRFEHSLVQFTLIDVHADAVRAARAVIAHFELSGMVRAFVTGDATAYRHPDDRRLHVVVTETMQRALTREPQVAVVRHLAPQLVPGGILVPESVRVDLVLSGAAADSDVHVATLIDVRKATADAALDAGGCLPPVRVTMPPGSSNPSLRAAYRTVIRVYGGHVLDAHESGLTHPEIVWDLLPAAPGEELEFRYQIGENPGLRWRRSG